MTRWARVHSTHRTQKQPEEATPWNEFHKQKGQPDQESSISEKVSYSISMYLYYELSMSILSVQIS